MERPLRLFAILAFFLLFSCKNAQQGKHQNSPPPSPENEKLGSTSMDDPRTDSSEQNESRRDAKKETGAKGQEAKTHASNSKSSPPTTRSMSGSDETSSTKPAPGSEAFRARYDQKTQRFRFEASSDTSLHCQKGTVLHFPADAFVTKEGLAVKGPVEVRVKEYYSNAAILLAGLGTKSGEQLLESKGMVHVEAEANGKACELKEGKAMKIAFPRKKAGKDMKLFRGIEKEKGRVDWTVESPVDLNKTYSKKAVDQKASFPGGTSGQAIYLSGNTEYPAPAQAKGAEGVVKVAVTIGRDGSIQDPTLVQSVSGEVDREVFEAIMGMPRWDPAKKEGRPVPSEDTISVSFQLDGQDREKAKKLKAKDFKRKVEKGELSMKEASTGQVSNYLFASSELGWLNCDAFRDGTARRKYAVRFPNPKDSRVQMLFHDKKSLLCADDQRSKFVFENVPKGKKVSLVIVKPTEKGYSVAIKSTTTNKVPSSFDFEPVSMEGLKEKVKTLNEI